MSNRILGLMIFVAGVALLAFGLNASDSLSDSIAEGVTGRYTDKTMLYLIAGAVLAIGGAALAWRGGGRARGT